MTSVANTVAMTTLAVYTLQPLIFYNLRTFNIFKDSEVNTVPTVPVYVKK